MATFSFVQISRADTRGLGSASSRFDDFCRHSATDFETIFLRTAIPYQASASLQAIKVYQLGQDVCSAGNIFEKIAEGCR